jgi:hypothetical protein
MNSYIGNKQVLKTTEWRRCVVTASGNAGYVNVTLLEGPTAGTHISIDEQGNEYQGPHDQDGLWEQAKLFGNRIVWDYAGMVCPPVVYDIMVS